MGNPCRKCVRLGIDYCTLSIRTDSASKFHSQLPQWESIILKMEHVSIMDPLYPAITIHKGWMGTVRSDSDYRTPVRDYPDSDRSQNMTRTRPARRQYEFINASTWERKHDPHIRRLVKSHVKKNQVLDQRPQKETSVGHLNVASNVVTAKPSSTIVNYKKSNLEASTSSSYDVYSGRQLSGLSTAWCTWEYPIQMHPRTHRLLELYLTYAASRMYPGHLPLRSNPLTSSAWFRYAVTDAGMLHAMLYSGALYLALVEGKTESSDTIYHLAMTISIVNKRLNSSPHFIQDSTIGAVTCLAIGAVRIFTAILREYAADTIIGRGGKSEHMAHSYAGFEADHREERRFVFLRRNTPGKN